MDREFVERSRALAENILLPSLEDIVVLKLMSGVRKDIAGLKRILHRRGTGWTRSTFTSGSARLG